jgi:hypothetical protein
VRSGRQINSDVQVVKSHGYERQDVYYHSLLSLVSIATMVDEFWRFEIWMFFDLFFFILRVHHA